MGNEIAHGSFRDEEKGKSSTYRELAAVKYVLQGFSHLLKHQVVLWNSDNMNVAKIIRNGSSKDQLQYMALDIFRMCLRHDIQIIPKWIPREDNEQADSISRYVDTDNWSIDNETFQFLQGEFGCFTIDRFADDKNKKVNRFDARFHCPNVENVNTFTSNWGNEFNWLCPPISMIGEALKHAKLCKCRGVLLVPEWKSAYFWPLITSDGLNFEAFIKEYRVLDPYFFSSCKNRSVFNGFTNFRSIALLLDFCHT